MAFEIKNGVLKKYKKENGETEVVIPDSVTEIGYEAFYGCESLKEVTIPDSVTEIGNGAFEYCSSLKEVTIPDSVTEIGYEAFYKCKSLKEVTIPESVTTIDGSAFSGTKWLEEYPEDLVIVGNGILFKYKGNDTNVVIPDSVTTIGESAFSRCESLTEVTIPDSVTKIGCGAFYECKSLKEVTIPESVTTIDGYAFSDTKWLEKYPEDLVIVGNGILIKYKGNDTNVVIPDSVTEIGYEAFEYCSGLTEVTIPDSVTEIGKEAFYKCESLTEVTIPDSVREIGKEAFYECESLKKVTIGNSVTEIGDWAFSRCKSLTEVTIPDSVTKIGSGAFRGCSSLTSINVNENNKKYSDLNGILFDKDKKILIQYPIGKTETSYTIPDSVTEIGECAFEYCSSLTEVTIPDLVTVIGKGAFDGCERFTSVIKGIKFKADGEKFSKDFNEIIKIPETKDFSAKLYTPLKTAVIVEYYLQSGDADAEAFIKKGITRIMKFLIDGDNVGPILKLLETGKFVTDKNILTFIDYANSLQKMEIQLIFMNYSHEHFKPKKTNFKI